MPSHDFSGPPFDVRVHDVPTRAALCELVGDAMQRAGFLENPAPPAAVRWIDTFVEAYGDALETVADAVPVVARLREEAVVVPAVDLEALRNRQVLFFLDAVGQYVDDQSELRGLPVARDLALIGEEFGLTADDARHATRVALTGEREGPPLDLLFPLLGHDRILIRIGAINSHLLHGRGLEPIPFGPDGKPFQTLAGKKPS